MSYDNESKFAIFKNDKGDNAKRPDYRGTFTLGGIEYKMSGWIKTSKKTGDKFIGGVIEPAQPRNEAAGAGNRPAFPPQPPQPPLPQFSPDAPQDEVPF